MFLDMCFCGHMFLFLLDKYQEKISGLCVRCMTTPINCCQKFLYNFISHLGYMLFPPDL